MDISLKYNLYGWDDCILQLTGLGIRGTIMMKFRLQLLINHKIIS